MNRIVVMHLLASRRGFCAFLLALLLLCLGALVIPLAAQGLPGTWTATMTVGTLADSGSITFGTDGAFEAQRRREDLRDHEAPRRYTFNVGRWAIVQDRLCVREDGAQRSTCHPFVVRGDTLDWNGIIFTREAP